MHRDDKIGGACALFSAACAFARPWVAPYPVWNGLLWVAWLAPLVLWLGPKTYRQWVPPCTRRERRDMHKLGYSWDRHTKEFHQRLTYDDYDYVRYRDGLWQFLSYREVGADAMLKETTPVDSPITAHVLGQLNQEPYTW